jgi:hypothetical protein
LAKVLIRFSRRVKLIARTMYRGSPFGPFSSTQQIPRINSAPLESEFSKVRQFDLFFPDNFFLASQRLVPVAWCAVPRRTRRNKITAIYVFDDPSRQGTEADGSVVLQGPRRPARGTFPHGDADGQSKVPFFFSRLFICDYSSRSPFFVQRIANSRRFCWYGHFLFAAAFFSRPG